jgi:hypothetical protein
MGETFNSIGIDKEKRRKVQYELLSYVFLEKIFVPKVFP